MFLSVSIVRAMVALRLLIFALLFSGGDANLGKFSLAGVDPTAVCTDGSPAAYYYKPTTAAPIISCDQCIVPDTCNCGYCGSYGGCSFTCGHSGTRPPLGQPCASDHGEASRAASTWLVHLDGGGWCYDEASCRSRCGDPTNPYTSSVCSSKKYSDTMGVGGIFFPADNDDLNHAHKVFVKYCTSDAHMGDGDAFGFQFRGKLVVQAVLKDLVQKHGLGSGMNGRKDTLIFAGGSAGARGAMVHLDYVPEMLGDAAVNVDIVGMLDSPAWIDMSPLSSSFPGFPYITQHVHRYANVDHLGADCQLLYPDDESWKCMFGQYRLPTLKTRFFLVASQYDSYQLGNNVGHKPSSAAEQAYAEKFAAATKALDAKVTAMPGGNGVFSWACYNHCTGTSDSGFNRKTCGASATTMSVAFKQFLGWSSETSAEWIDDCKSWECGNGCNLANESSATNISEISDQKELEFVV